MPAADLPELVNPVKARMQAGDVALGMIVRLARSGDVVRIGDSRRAGSEGCCLRCRLGNRW